MKLSCTLLVLSLLSVLSWSALAGSASGPAPDQPLTAGG